ncbi:Kinesin-like protein [Actinidia chinensis var. chinensis]|uniref:Kinesin-like protein n=1 Tax=Actinidia chinensis var. chinensis TaxID=1590841 RepID=A0A2R6RF04_ACTCC|nr:Kinesin-like protein [Actinidia chinensis var. chinensis]
MPHHVSTFIILENFLPILIMILTMTFLLHDLAPEPWKHDEKTRSTTAGAFLDPSSLILNLLRSPAPILFSDHSPAMYQRPQISPAGFALLLLGIALALMLCGSVKFLLDSCRCLGFSDG